MTSAHPNLSINYVRKPASVSISEHSRPATVPFAGVKRAHSHPPLVQRCPPSGYVDLGSIVGSLESSDTKKEYKPVPEDILQLMRRICREHQVDSPVWAQSPTDWKEIRILGRGVTRIQDKLVEEAQIQHPEFRFVTRESGPMHTRLFQDLFVVQRRTDERSSQWIDAARASSQLIVTAEDRRSCRADVKRTYLVTTAHFILGGEQCEKIIQSTDSRPLEEIRRKIDSQTDYIVEVVNPRGTRRINLALPVKIAHRHFYRNISTTTNNPHYRCVAGKCSAQQQLLCPHMWMNDIAILPIETVELLHLQHELRQDQRIQFDGIASAGLEVVTKMIQSRKKIYVNESEYELVSSFRSVDETTERTFADHLTFIPATNEGRRMLDEGSSGTIVYVKHTNRNLALAMLIGEVAEFPGCYQAVLLAPALREIEMDYSHHVDDIQLSIFQPNFGH